MASTQQKWRDVHLHLRPDLYAQISTLSRKNRRTVTAELTLAVECYLERAVRGSVRWHELAGEEKAYFPPVGLGAEPK